MCLLKSRPITDVQITQLGWMERASMAAALFEVAEKTCATQNENEDVRLRRVMSLGSISAKTYGNALESKILHTQHTDLGGHRFRIWFLLCWIRLEHCGPEGFS